MRVLLTRRRDQSLSVAVRMAFENSVDGVGVDILLAAPVANGVMANNGFEMNKSGLGSCRS